VQNDTTPPSPPTLVSPDDGIVSSDPLPVFIWQDVIDPSGVSYRLQVDNQADFSSPEIYAGNLASPSHSPAQALADGDYSWRVMAVDGAGNAGAWSAVRTLTIDAQTPACNPGTPTVDVQPADQSASAGITLAYTVSVINNDTADCPASTFYLDHDVPIDWTGFLSATSLILQPGQAGNTPLSVTSAANALPGSYGLRVSVSDVAGTTLSSSSKASYTVAEPQADNEPPSVPTGLSADLKLKQINLSWNTATDNVGVAGYRLWRNGAVIGEMTGTDYIDRDITTGETYTYQVVAYDAAGNTSADSNSATVTYAGKTNPGKGKP
jgi:hypothetical protein